MVAFSCFVVLGRRRTATAGRMSAAEGGTKEDGRRLQGAGHVKADDSHDGQTKEQTKE